MRSWTYLRRVFFLAFPFLSFALASAQGTKREVVVVAVTTGNGSSPAIQILSDSLSQQLPLASPSVQRTSRYCSAWTCPRHQAYIILDEGGPLLVAQLSYYVVLTALQQPGSGRDLWRDADRAELDLRSFLLDTSTPCALLGVVNISNGYTAYCLQSDTVYSCDLTINSTDLPRSHFICSDLSSHDTFADPNLFSNFVLGNNLLVYFTYSEDLYRVRHDTLRISWIKSLGGARCRHAQYSLPSLLYLYCDSGTSFDIDFSSGYFVARQINGTGVNFPCGYDSGSFFVRQVSGRSEVGFGGETVEVNLTKEFDAVCVADARNRSLFYVLDRDFGLYRISGSTLTVQPVLGMCSPLTPCTNLIVNSDLSVVVLRSSEQGQEVIVHDRNLEILWRREIPNGVTGVGVYTVNLPLITPTTTPSKRMSEEHTSGTGQVPGLSQPALIGMCVMAAGVLAIAVLLAIVCVVIYWRVYRRPSAVDKMRSFFWALRGSKKQQPPPVTEVKDSGKVNTEQVMPGHQPSLSTTTTSPNGSSSCSKQTSSSSQGQVLASQLQQLITEDACHGYEHDSTTVDPREAEN